MSGKTIRIGIGTPESPKSTIWSVVVGGTNVYIVQRFMKGLAKFSLHGSGRWRFAASSIGWTKKEDRALLKWQKPNPVFGSWTLGPVIIFPPLLVDLPNGFPDLYDKKITWLSPPTDKQQRIVAIVFSKGESSIDSYLEKVNLSPDWITSLDIKDDGRVNADEVWIISWIEDLGKHTEAQVLDILKNLKINYKKTTGRNTNFAVATPMYPGTETERARGLSPTIIEVVIDKKNFVEDENS